MHSIYRFWPLSFETYSTCSMGHPQNVKLWFHEVGVHYQNTCSIDKQWKEKKLIQKVNFTLPSTKVNELNLTRCNLHICRFLRHVPVIYVDYPGATSLKQIYGTFNRAMMRLIPELRAYADPLTNAMVDFYMMSQVRQHICTLQIQTQTTNQPDIWSFNW